jgi:hypothetical protein
LPGSASGTCFALFIPFLSEEKKLSIAALFQTLPERLMEQVTPWSAISRWNGSLVYWLS